MKLIFRDEIPVELQEELRDVRYVLLSTGPFGGKVIAKGNDPRSTTEGRVPVEYFEPTDEQWAAIRALQDERGITRREAIAVAGVALKSKHYRSETGEIRYRDGELYRIDERAP